MNLSIKKSKGFGLLELIIVAVVSLFIMATVYYAYKISERDVKTKEASALVLALIRNADMISTSNSTYRIKNASGDLEPITISKLINGASKDSLPNSALIKNGKIYSPYGEVTVAINSSSPNAFDLFRVNLLHVPSNACLHVLSRLSGKVYDMYVNNHLVALYPPETALANGRNNVRMDQASQLCDNARYLTLSFRKLKRINFYELRRKPFGNQLSTKEKNIILPLYNRTQNALQEKENAQKAFD